MSRRRRLAGMVLGIVLVGLAAGLAGDASRPASVSDPVQGIIEELDKECRRRLVFMLGPEKASRLAELVRQKKPEVVVECGTAIGYSGLWIARELKKAGRGKLITIEIDPQRAQEAQRNFQRAGLAEYVTVRVGDARAVVKELSGPVDFVLLDCGYENYYPVFVGLESKLRPGAVVVADNVGLGAAAMGDYLKLVRSKYRSRTEKFEVNLPWAWHDAMEVTLIETAGTAATQSVTPRKKLPVILDTDIGDDIDDTWALTLLLKSPELDPKLVVSDSGDTEYRGKIIARLLEVAGRTDIPVGVGLRQNTGGGRQAAWVEGYDLARYPGKVHRDGVGAIIRTILESPEPITLICIGPVPNIQAALEREPKIATRARFIGMHGSIRKGYGGKPTPDAEWNVVANPAACRKAFTAAWPMTITPLDTCGLVRLQGEKYRKVAQSKDPLVRALIENYRIWRKAQDPNAPDEVDASSVLFDTVAVYLAISTELVRIERIPLVVTDKGFTVPDPNGKPIDCAMEWKDLGAFEDFLVERLAR